MRFRFWIRYILLVLVTVLALGILGLQRQGEESSALSLVVDMRPAMLQQTVVTSKGDKIARIDAVKKFTHALVEVTSGRALGLVVCADVCRYLLPPTLDRANFLSYIDALVVAPEGVSGAWQWPEGQQYLYIGMDAPALATLPLGAQQVIIGEDLHNLADIPGLVQDLSPAQRGSAGWAIGFAGLGLLVLLAL